MSLTLIPEILVKRSRYEMQLSFLRSQRRLSNLHEYQILLMILNLLFDCSIPNSSFHDFNIYTNFSENRIWNNFYFLKFLNIPKHFMVFPIDHYGLGNLKREIRMSK